MMTLEQARELRNSTVWKWVEDELDHRIKAKMDVLCKCDKDALDVIQAELTVLNELKRLPDDVISREEDPD